MKSKRLISVAARETRPGNYCVSGLTLTSIPDDHVLSGPQWLFRELSPVLCLSLISGGATAIHIQEIEKTRNNKVASLFRLSGRRADSANASYEVGARPVLPQLEYEHPGHAQVMMKGSIQQEGGTVVNVNTADAGAPVIKVRVIEKQRQAKIARDSNTHFQQQTHPLGRKQRRPDLTRQNRSQRDLTGNYRTFHPPTSEPVFFSSAHKTFSRIDHILGHKTNLKKAF